MSALERLLGAFAPGHELDHGGKSYEFRRVDQRMKCELEAAYFKRCRETIYAMKAELSDAEYDRALQRVSDAHDRGEHVVTNDGPRTWFFGQGFAQLVAVMTGASLPEAEALASEREAEAAHVALCVWFSSFPDEKKKLLRAEAEGRIPPAQLGEMVRLLTPPPASTPPGSPSRESTPTSSPA